jgi:hypothetical protein
MCQGRALRSTLCERDAQLCYARHWPFERNLLNGGETRSRRANCYRLAIPPTIDGRSGRILASLGFMLPVLWSFGSACPLRGQKTIESASDWQAAAGGSKTSEVASVKPITINPATFNLTAWLPNFALDNADGKPAGGRLSARFGLWTYISFAYKLTSSRQQERAAVARLPKWFDTDTFEIEARAEGNPTKDQMRLKMQSLLAERFKLTVHFESQVVPFLP